MAWKLKFIGDIRGPAGYNATGAAQDLATLAAYVKQTAGPNDFATALIETVDEIVEDSMLKIPSELPSFLNYSGASVGLSWTTGFPSPRGSTGFINPVSGAKKLFFKDEVDPQKWMSHGVVNSIEPANTGASALVAINRTIRAGGPNASWSLGMSTDAPWIEIFLSGGFNVNDGKPPMILLDGLPIWPDWLGTPDLGAQNSIHLGLTFPDVRSRRIEIIGNFKPGSIMVPSASSVTPSRRVGAPRLYILGDSWVEGTGQTKPSPSWARIVQVLSPWDVAVGGIGGTGYVNGSFPYGHSGRRASINEYKPDVLLIAGSINDSSKAPGDVRSAADALYQSVLVDLPSTKIIVVGVQDLNHNSAQAQAVQAALKEAADSATNVIGFFDPIADNWGRGGWTVGPTDFIHPSRLGVWHLADKAIQSVRLATMLAGDNRW